MAGHPSIQTRYPIVRAGLITQPSPLERWERLSESVGIEIFAKRDDVSRIGLGGNKLRKLDLILGQAIGDKADVVITTGGIQSNHCRLTAAAAARLGMRSVVYLRGRKSSPPAGNLLLDSLFGAEIHVIEDSEWDEADDKIVTRADELSRAGLRPLIIPMGGANGLGTLSFVLAAEEIRDQFKDKHTQPECIIVAAGTGSTFAGLALGTSLTRAETTVLGVSVSRTTSRLVADAEQLQTEATGLLSERSCTEIVTRPTWVTDQFIGGGYTIPTEAGIQAVKRLAATEGVLVDLTYTSKALACLIDMAKQGQLNGPVVFWHTGGIPELFARDPALVAD